MLKIIQELKLSKVADFSPSTVALVADLSWIDHLIPQNLKICIYTILKMVRKMYVITTLPLLKTNKNNSLSV